MFLNPEENLFHVHTFRCRHADEVPDDVYVKKAIEMGVKSIWFTDHAPFPENPFGYRMMYDELDEYLDTLLELKDIYKNQIDIHIGLEAEYFPTYDKNGYYQQLKADERLDLLLLGQHMAQTDEGGYTFSWDKEKLDRDEAGALGKAICQGIESGYFDIVAHPDRSFRRKKHWDDDMAYISENIISTAGKHGLILEQNETSKRHKHHYWEEFWKMNEGRCQIVIGLDAHSPEELVKIRREKLCMRI